MACRNRTSAFFELRAQTKHPRPIPYKDKTSTLPLIGNEQQDIPLDTITSMPSWIRLNDIDAKLKVNAERIEKLGKLHAKNLETFDGNPEIEREIEILTKEITTDFVKTHNMIKGIKKKNLTSEEVKLQKNIQAAKSAKFHAISTEFKKKQRAYLSKLQKNSNNSFGWTNDDIEDDQEEPAGIGFTMAQMEIVNNMDQEVQKRDKEIRQIVASIEELSSIFHDISLLVIKQGTLMDQIEYNLEQTYEAVGESAKQLGEANELHKGYRTRLCILLVLIILIVSMVFVAIIKAII